MPPGVAILLGAISAWLQFDPSADLAVGLDPDSALRLVQVRDLLAGQGWYDLSQHRLGLGEGVEMHWSRLVDAPMASFLWASDPFVGTAGSERLLMVVWPTLWLVVALWAGLSLSGRLGGPFAAVVAGLGLATLPFLTAAFAPGNLDHHNLQLALLMLASWGFAARHDRPAAAALAGCAVATSLVVGIELLPVMAALSAAVAVIWALRGEAERRAAWRFGAALGLGLVALTLLAAPHSAWVGGHCDAISMDLLLPGAGLAGLLALAAPSLSRRSVAVRLGVLLGGGSAWAAAATWLYPACLSNPLDTLDPLLARHWLDHVQEAQGMIAAAERRWGGTLVIQFAFGAGAALACLHLGWRAETRRRAEWVTLSLLLAILAVFASYQIRFLAFLVLLAIPVWACLASHLRRKARAGAGSTTALAGAACLLAVLTPLLARVVPFTLPWAPPGQRGPAAAVLSHVGCQQGDGLERIAALPPGRVSATSNLGASLLLRTPHHVLAAPYHRNQAGMLGQIGVALAETPAEAERRLRALEVDYVVLCRQDPELWVLRGEDQGAEPLLLRLARDEATLQGFAPVLDDDAWLVLARAPTGG